MFSNISGAGQVFLSNLSRVQSSLNEAQLQISSGFKVRDPSDAPDEVSAILQLHANIQANKQTTANLNTVQSEVATADQSLSGVTTLLDQVSVLASQGTGISQTAASRAAIAGQVQALAQQIVGISQTSFAGRYIFSGDADQSPAYQYDTATQSITRLQVSSSTRQVADTSGSTFPAGLSANQIFDVRDAADVPAKGNIFAALTAVSAALLANDPVALQAATAAVGDASAYLNQQQTFYGQTENRITAALSQANTANLSSQQDLSDKQDADVTAAILELQQSSGNLQAAMASYAKLPHTSLFSVLNQ